MKFLILFLFVSLTLNLSFALPEDCYCRLGDQSKLVQGKPSDQVISWHVSLQANGRHICSGIILDSETIVTLNSCITGYETKELSIVAGINSLDKRNENNTYPLKTIKYAYNNHESNSGPNNTAILKLAKKLELTRGHIEKACIEIYDSKYSEPLLFAQRFLITGFGFNEEIVFEPDGQLKKLPEPTNQLKIAEVKIDYAKTNEHSIYVKPKLFRKNSVCVGDEGSPLIIQKKNGLSKVVAFANEMIETKDMKGFTKFCTGPGRFIKFSAIAKFIEKFDVSNMCLEYE